MGVTPRYVIVWVDGFRSSPHTLDRMLYDVSVLNGGLYPRISHVEVVDG